MGFKPIPGLHGILTWSCPQKSVFATKTTLPSHSRWDFWYRGQKHCEVTMALASSTGTASSSQTPTAPTYTTAGTIYNPNSTQPLQPPARRGRSLKWTSSVLHPDLALLPKSLLSNLPLGPYGTTRVSPAPKYSPLQQNYDRAVSPAVPDIKAEETPRSVVSDMFSPNQEASSFSAIGHGILPEDSSDSEDEHSEASMKPLMNMTVKSLQNLASYPNPNQRMAQKAILRSVKSTLAASDSQNSSITRLDFLATRTPEPFNPANTRFDGVQDGNNGILFTNQKQLRASLQPSITDGSHDVHGRYTTMSSGVPQPLTAGPPGQRQYRPGAFEASLKTLEPMNMTSLSHEQDFATIMEQNALPSGLLGSSAPSAPFGDGNLSALVKDSTPLPEEGLGFPRSSERVRKSELGYSQGFFDYYKVASEHATNPGVQPSPATHRAHDARSRPEASGCLSQSSEERKNCADIAWRSGDDIFFGTDGADDSYASAHGVIGDGRPGFNRGVRGSLGMIEADKMTTSEHVKPLLELALTTLESPGFRSQFSKPDPSLIDPSPEGNRSLFGK